MHTLVVWGALLGWGAAIPIGPVNLEMLRYNLQSGTRFGVFFGLGACVADLTYLLLLSMGGLYFFAQAPILRWLAILGALVIGYFGVQALLKSRALHSAATQIPFQHSVFLTAGKAYLMTLFNPYSVLFWVSISAQVSLHHYRFSSQSPWWLFLGVLLGTVSWVSVFNGILHLTRSQYSDRTWQRLNILSGVILLGFASWALLFAWKV